MPPVFGPGVVVACALEVLRWLQREHRGAVGDGEQRHLGTVEELLDHDLRVVALGEAGARVRDRLCAVGRDDDALAGGESVVLDDVRRAELVEGCTHLLDRGADVGHRRRHARLGHDLLGERLAALELRGSGRRAEARDAQGTHGIRGTRHQRHLGADNHEIRGHRARQVCDGCRARHVDGLRGDDLRDAGVARCGHHLRHRVVCQQGRDDGVLTSTGPDDEDLHATSLVRATRRAAGAVERRSATRSRSPPASRPPRR